MRAPGAEARPSARNASKSCWPNSVRRPGARKRSSGCSILSMDFVRARCWKLICATWLTRTALWPGRSPNCSNSFASTDPTIVADAIEKAAAARAFGADYVANILRQQQSPAPAAATASRCAIRCCNELVTDPLSLLAYDAFILESEKEPDDLPRTETATDLNLTAMSHQIETTIAEAAAKNLSVVRHSGMARRHGTGSAQRPRHRAALQVLAPAGAAQHRCAFTSTITRAACRPRTASCVCSISTFFVKGTNLVLIGNPGVGKTFLAQVIGWKACQANQRVLFTTAMDMLNHLLASQVDHSLVRKLKAYTEPALLICDELGYLALDQQTSNLFYQVISTRHSQKRSTIITTNTPFSDWGNILFNTTIATAIADRLVENSEIFLLGGDSLRKANKNSESAGRVVLRWLRSSAALWRYPGRRSPPGNPSTALPDGRRSLLSRSSASDLPHVQLQRQSSVPALADGIPVVRGVPVAGPRHAARLPAL